MNGLLKWWMDYLNDELDCFYMVPNAMVGNVIFIIFIKLMNCMKCVWSMIQIHMHMTSLNEQFTNHMPVYIYTRCDYTRYDMYCVELFSY